MACFRQMDLLSHVRSFTQKHSEAVEMREKERERKKERASGPDLLWRAMPAAPRCHKQQVFIPPHCCPLDIEFFLVNISLTI